MGRGRLATLVVVLTVGLASVAAASPTLGTFTDDDGDVFEGSIEAIAAERITEGCNPPANTHFCPDGLVTRGEMAVFMVRGFGYYKNGGGDLFTDDDGRFYEVSADRLRTAGVTLGCNPPANDHFCGERVVSREEMAAFLVRARSLPHYNGPDRFIDDDDSPFEGAIERLAQANITWGCNPPLNDRYCPTDPVRRAEMASFLSRTLGLHPPSPPFPGDSVDCSDFDTWRDAQNWYEWYLPHYGDVAFLDDDLDLIACESLPDAP
jgi:hypothetical protein